MGRLPVELIFRETTFKAGQTMQRLVLACRKRLVSFLNTVSNYDITRLWFACKPVPYNLIFPHLVAFMLVFRRPTAPSGAGNLFKCNA